jgi:hypothetical protein
LNRKEYPNGEGGAQCLFLRSNHIFENFEFFFMFLDLFDVLVSKINFFKKKNIILMHFQVKSTLNNNIYHNPKHLQELVQPTEAAFDP